MRPLIATAEELIFAVKGLPTEECVRFFTLLGENVFEKEDFSHDEVFSTVAHAEFSFCRTRSKIVQALAAGGEAPLIVIR